MSLFFVTFFQAENKNKFEIAYFSRVGYRRHLYRKSSRLYKSQSITILANWPQPAKYNPCICHHPREQNQRFLYRPYQASFTDRAQIAQAKFKYIVHPLSTSACMYAVRSRKPSKSERPTGARTCALHKHRESHTRGKSGQLKSCVDALFSQSRLATSQK